MVIEHNVRESEKEEQWDMIIEPYNNVFDLKLKDVWQYRDLLWLLVRRDFVSFYKQTILGPLWFFIQPLLTTIMCTFLSGWYYRLELFCRLPYKNLHCFQRQRQHLRQSLLSPAYHAFKYCSQ